MHVCRNSALFASSNSVGTGLKCNTGGAYNTRGMRTALVLRAYYPPPKLAPIAHRIGSMSDYAAENEDLRNNEANDSDGITRCELS